MSLTRIPLAVVSLVIAAYGTYAFLAWRSPLFDRVEREKALFLAESADSPSLFTEADRRAAWAYFQRNPNVAGDAFFGPDGPMGERGALEHYRRHGRFEGLVWEDPTPLGRDLFKP